MRSADVEDEDLLQFSELHELDTVRCQELANTTGRLAARVRLELVLAAVGVHRTRPWLKRNRRTSRIRGGRPAATGKPHAFLPRGREDRASVCIARRGSRGRTGLTAAAATLRVRGRATASIRNADLHTR